MNLSAKFLESVCDINSFTYASGDWVELSEGDSATIYFQLVDRSKNKPDGLRYMPDDTSVLSVVIENIDNTKKITRSATQPFSADPSIWCVSIFATDALRGTATLRLTLTEGSVPTQVVTHAKIINAIRVKSATAL